MKYNFILLLLMFSSLSAFSDTTCLGLGYSSNGLVQISPIQNGPIKETPIGETSYDYVTATLWCVGGETKAGYEIPQVIGPSSFQMFGYNNCIGAYQSGSCCSTNVSYTPTKAGVERAVIVQQEYTLNNLGAVKSTRMRCYDLQGIGATDNYKLDVKLFDKDGAETDINLHEMEPSRIPCGVAGSITNRRKLHVKCVVEDLEGNKTSVNGCKLKANLLEGDNDGGHSHGTNETRLGKIGIIKNSFIDIPKDGIDFYFESPEASGESILLLESINPSGTPIKEEYETIFRTKIENLEALNVVGLRADIDSHPGNGNYVTSAMNSKLSLAVSEFRSQVSLSYGESFVPELETEAASLSWGGLFDINKDWSPPHCGHRNGNQVDFSMSVFSIYNEEMKGLLRGNLERSIRSVGLNFPVQAESPSGNRHWHIQD